MSKELETYADELWQIYPRVKKGAPTEKFWRKYDRAIAFSRNQMAPLSVKIQPKMMMPDIAVAYQQLTQRKYTFFRKESPPTGRYIKIILESTYYSFFETGFVHIGLALDQYHFGLHMLVWWVIMLIWTQVEKKEETYFLKSNLECFSDLLVLDGTTRIRYKHIAKVEVTKKWLRITSCAAHLGDLTKVHELSLYDQNSRKYDRGDLKDLRHFFKLVIQRNSLKGYSTK